VLLSSDPQPLAPLSDRQSALVKVAVWPLPEMEQLAVVCIVMLLWEM